MKKFATKLLEYTLIALVFPCVVAAGAIVVFFLAALLIYEVITRSTERKMLAEKREAELQYRADLDQSLTKVDLSEFGIVGIIEDSEIITR